MKFDHYPRFNERNLKSIIIVVIIITLTVIITAVISLQHNYRQNYIWGDVVKQNLKLVCERNTVSIDIL